MNFIALCLLQYKILIILAKKKFQNDTVTTVNRIFENIQKMKIQPITFTRSTFYYIPLINGRYKPGKAQII